MRTLPNTNHIQLDGAVLCGADMGVVKYISIDDWYREYITSVNVEACRYCVARIANDILDEFGYEEIDLLLLLNAYPYGANL